MAQAPAAAPATDGGTSMWISVGYYVLLFVLLATIVGIVGKILRVYDLTSQIQGKKSINWNNVMAVVCILFLVVGLYGAYWEFTEQGTLTLPEAASIHGQRPLSHSSGDPFP